MKKLILTLVLVLTASFAQAQTVACSVSGASAKQQAQYAKFLAVVNADRVAQGLEPYANFSQHCAGLMLSAFQNWIAQQDKIDAEAVARAAQANGDTAAPNNQCTLTGQAAGCTKASVACWVLTGSPTCTQQEQP